MIPPAAPGPARPGLPAPERSGADSVKILVAGGFGVGKTTFVRAVSEIDPVGTEAALSGPGHLADDVTLTPRKRTTTAALDFGRVALDADLQLHLFGTPGQHRFCFLWDDLTSGAVGAVVLADTRRLADCFPAVDFLQARGLPYLVALNCFDAVLRHDVEAVRAAIGLDEDVPLVQCDARERDSAKRTLITLVAYVMRRWISDQRP